jgi:Fe-S oxidoreductase
MWHGILLAEPGPLDAPIARLAFLTLTATALVVFGYVVWRRLTPLLQAAPDPRMDRPAARCWTVLHYWLAQWKQPRYPFAGLLHIAIFAGFLVLATRSLSLVVLGITGPLTLPAFMNGAVELYSALADYAATLVLIAVTIAAARRILFRHTRYEVPPQFGKSHAAEAIVILCLIAVLMIAESIFDASRALLGLSDAPSAFTLRSLWYEEMRSIPATGLQRIESGSYLLHELTFFGFLCLLPFGKHFHVLTSLFNVFFAKIDREQLKPVRWGVGEDEIASSQSVGVKTFTDFTWKQMLDFYSCADCGRCSDQCPSNAAGRPLSPRFLGIKAREYAFTHYPVLRRNGNGTALVGSVYSEDEIWSCTTCGACEQECPLLVEHIDKIVDLRRGLIDQGSVPATLQKPLKAIESRGNPYGKLQKKRADWTKSLEEGYSVPVADGNGASALYFVDSITSYDDRMQSIARATARVLARAGVSLSILGPKEQDSGHEVRRFGEEMLFFSLRDQNTEAILAARPQRLIASDPHAYNALKHDYTGLPPVEHVSEVMARAVRKGTLRFGAARDTDVYTLHDPCYLGRHNHVYDAPREVLDSVPGLRRVEMKRCRDRSFCCGGGGLMLFYEAKESERMGVTRVRMAAEAGATVIVTACPFCLANLEDAIKVAGLEAKISATDLTELADRQLSRPSASAGA